jgi:zinc-binding alcohol dehydrogenase family protein
MRAVAFERSLPVRDPNCFVDIDIPRPEPGPRDLLVRVEAVSVNPVDVKVRAGGDPPGGRRILGYDAAGTVVAAGPSASLFAPGDEVYYAGSLIRPGADAEYHLVDERIVGRKPRTLGFAEAAALPLTAITAWELLFHRIGVRMQADRRSLLLVGGAGGVGSIAIQIARVLTGLTVIATASRPETVAWCRELGAHHVIDHTRPLGPQLAALGFAGIDIVLGLNKSAAHWPEIAATLAPLGHVGVIDGLGDADLASLRAKGGSLHFELMFTRPRFETPDMIAQHELLDEVARLVDEGKLRTTLTRVVGPIDAANLREAHRLVETGRTIGKVCLAGFP